MKKNIIVVVNINKTKKLCNKQFKTIPSVLVDYDSTVKIAKGGRSRYF